MRPFELMLNVPASKSECDPVHLIVQTPGSDTSFSLSYSRSGKILILDVCYANLTTKNAHTPETPILLQLRCAVQTLS